MTTNHILALHMRVSDLEKRLAGMIRHGPVEEVNAAEGWVRLNFGDGDNGPLLSAKVPYAQMAGGLKVHTPPTKGQNMTVIAPGGDMRQAIALPMTWSDQNASPSDKGDENVLTYGDVRFELRADEAKLTIGAFVLTFRSDGARFKLDGVEHGILAVGLKTTGGRIEHDGRDIGGSHKHPGIIRGGDLTDPPAA